jgi:hypothetical protein
VGAGIRDVLGESAPPEGAGRAGAGRRGIEPTCPRLWPALGALVEPEERGDPQSPLRWTVKSTRTPAGRLAGHGFDACRTAAGRLLRGHGCSLRGTAKAPEGTPARGGDRGRRFRRINDTARAFPARGRPAISADAEEKEPIGDFERPGRARRPCQDPAKAGGRSLARQAHTAAAPYGICDTGAGRGSANAGASHGAPASAAAPVRRRRSGLGRAACPRAARLLVAADSGGSSSARCPAFKVLLRQFALGTGIETAMARPPPGTPKRNKAEHRLFARAAMGAP